MGTLKLFRNLLIAFILLWIFVTVASEGFIQTSYRYIGEYELNSTVGTIQITDSRATKVNGYVKGTITNNTNHLISKLYIVLQCYSKKDNLLGTEYTQVENLAVGETREFEIRYQYDDVDHYTITTTEEAPEGGNLNLNLNWKNGNGYMDVLTRLAILAGCLAAVHAFLGMVAF